MYRRLVINLTLILLMNFSCISHGYERHDILFKRVLFGSDVTLKAKEQEKLTLLNYASRVAIDQYNGSYVTELNYLKSKGIKTISTIDDIDFTGNSHHQRYTHRGWTFSYVSPTGNWSLRKQLLLDTTKKVFGFNSTEQQDAFAAFMYYIHILGDHEGDKQDNTIDRIALGGRSDKLDILDELSKKYLPKLFKNQKEVNNLCEKLESINRNCAALLRRKGEGYDDRNVKRDVKELSPEEYKQYQEYAKKTFDVLAENIPALLKNEKWFTKVFHTLSQ